MPESRALSVLPVPAGPAVAEVLPALRRMLDDSGPALLPVPADDPVRTRLVVDAMDPHSPVDERAALLVCTSGSTGTPKGAMLSAAALAASARATDAALGGPGAWLLALPAHHVAGLQVLLRALRAGGDPVVMDVSRGFDPAALAAAVARLPTGVPRYTSLVPGQLSKVLDSGNTAALQALTRLDAVLVGGAAVDGRLVDTARRAGVRIVRTYGMSETAGGCVYEGMPLDGVGVTLDERTTDGTGRIVLSGPQVALGYRGLPGHPSFATAGSFRTEDSGCLDGRGRLRVLGRLDDALQVGGLTVLPQVLEDALRRHHLVCDAVVVGLPDPRLGTRPVAAVTVRGGCVPPSATELRGFVTDRLGGRSAPAQVVIVPDLPELPGGKVDRQAVQAAFREGRVR